MLWLAAMAVAVAQPKPPPTPVPPVVQARATVRIISGVRLKLDGKPNPDAPRPREAVIHTDRGPKQARLIEFE
ncbi:MAG TPA: hypothetical protein VFG41_07900 [Sphingomicrobium sp.]|jgi:hypothetical protein|nr:hypothetical protein [Sphingomicrobium sp.]